MHHVTFAWSPDCDAWLTHPPTLHPILKKTNTFCFFLVTVIVTKGLKKKSLVSVSDQKKNLSDDSTNFFWSLKVLRVSKKEIISDEKKSIVTKKNVTKGFTKKNLSDKKKSQ